MNQKIKIGVIGAGRWGPNLIGAFNRMDGVEMTRIADTNPLALQSLSNRFPTLQTTTSTEQLVEDKSIDAIPPRLMRRYLQRPPRPKPSEPWYLPQRDP